MQAGRTREEKEEEEEVVVVVVVMGGGGVFQDMPDGRIQFLKDRSHESSCGVKHRDKRSCLR